jgi:4-amino-4-deoxy-L-arabinose transferase-like glycosyltransferase
MSIATATCVREARWPVAAIVGLALLLRLAWAWHLPPVLDPALPDQAGYLELGRNLLAGRGLVLHDERFGQDIRANRMPGYPLLIALCGGRIGIVRTVQAALDASTVLAVWLLARRWLQRGPALTAAATTALNPFLIYFSGLILSETLTVALLAWAMVLLAHCRHLLWGTALLALAVHVRPSMALLPALLACGTAACRVTGSTRPRTLRGLAGAAGLGLLLTAAILLPWAARNARALGTWVWLTTNGGITQYDGWNPVATGAADQSFVQDPALAELAALGEVERDRAYADLARRAVREHWLARPADLARLTRHKIARTWSPIPLSSQYGGNRLYVMAGLAFALPVALLALLGAAAGPLPVRVRLWLLLPALYLTLVHALSVGSLRYRMPAEPLLAVLAGAGVAMLVARWRAWSSRVGAKSKPDPN